MVDINKCIKEAEELNGSKFKDLFNEEQQKEILDLLNRLDKKY